MREAMQREFETLDGKIVFKVNQLGGVKAMLLFAKLSKKLGPALVKFKNADKLDALTMLMGAIEPEDITATAKELLHGNCIGINLETAAVNTEAADQLDEIFTGKPFEILKLIMFALEVNYGDFFKAVGKSAG